MKRIFCSAALAAATLAGCTPGEPAVSLVGKWDGEITCYSMASPLQVVIDAATPEKAAVSMGSGGSLTWDATVAYDAATRAVTIKSGVPTGDAETIAGPLSADGKSITGEMERQLCTKFTLARAS